MNSTKIKTAAPVDPSAKQSRYVREHTQCSICETILEIHHEINRKELQLKEEAYCGQCGIRARTSVHIMH